jgi:hypothetical protein
MRFMRMIGIAPAAALLLVALTCNAQDGKMETLPSSTSDAPRWAFSVTGSYYSFRNQDDFLLAVATAERGPLHLEARYNYEAQDSGSLFAGWKFSGGEKLTYELTPILGAVFGQKEGIAGVRGEHRLWHRRLLHGNGVCARPRGSGGQLHLLVERARLQSA